MINWLFWCCLMKILCKQVWALCFIFQNCHQWVLPFWVRKFIETFNFQRKKGILLNINLRTRKIKFSTSASYIYLLFVYILFLVFGETIIWPGKRCKNDIFLQIGELIKFDFLSFIGCCNEAYVKLLKFSLLLFVFLMRRNGRKLNNIFKMEIF